jgi:ribonuclease Z
MKKILNQKYPLVWSKDDFFIKIYCSIPNVATGILITTEQTLFIVDPGDGILRDLNKDIGAEEMLKVSDVFISHGHHDHVGGVWSLLTYLSVMKKKTLLKIHYPLGCKEIESIHNAFLKVYKKELTYQIELKPIDNCRSFVRDFITIKPFKVNHKEISNELNKSIAIPSLGYKFIYSEKSICYGGDTAFCTALVKNAKNSDLAIIEAGAKEFDNSELHMTKAQAIKIGKTAKAFFLVHVPE